MVLVKIKWFSVYIELLEQCQARVNTGKEVEILLLLLNGVPVAIVVWMWEYSWTGAMHSRWQEGNNKREAFEAKRDDGRQPVMPCDDDVYTSGDDKVKSLSRVWLFATLWIARPPCPSPTPGVYSNSCPSSRWCHPAISSSVVPFSSCPQSLPASGSFPMSQLFAWGGQSIGASASTSVPPMNTQDWSPLGWTDWISLQSKELSRVFSNTTVQKHKFFSAQLSSTV